MASVDLSMRPRAPAGWARSYFVAVSLLLLALTLAGFSDNLVTDIGQPSNRDPKFIVHGLFCLAWMILLVAQALLVRAGHVRLHRRLGLAGMALAVGVTLSTAYVFWAVWRGWAALDLEAQANRLLLPAYALLVALAHAHRRRPDWHKRLILIATFFMLGPVLGRVYDPVVVPLLPEMAESRIDRLYRLYFFAAWHGFFVSLLGFDWLAGHRIHRVSAAGYGLFCAIWLAVLLI